MLTCLWKNMLTKITTHLEKQYHKKLAQKFYKSTDQYYGFYTHFLLLHVGFQKSGKDDLKKTINLLSCIKSKKTYRLMTFPPKMASRHRQKEKENQTLLSSQKSHQHEKPHSHVKSSSATTIVHSFTGTPIIDKSSNIKVVNVKKALSPKLINILLMNSCPHARQSQIN